MPNPRGAAEGPRNIVLMHGINYFNAGDHGISLATFARLRQLFPEARFTALSPFLQAMAREPALIAAVRAGADALYIPESPDLFQLPIGGRPPIGQLLAGLTAAIAAILLALLPRGLRRLVVRPFPPLRALAEADVVISKGGGFLLDRGTRYPVPIHFIPIALATLLAPRVVLYAQTIGPLERPLSRLVGRWALKHVRLILPRDDYSVEYIRKDLGLTDVPMTRTADEAFQLPEAAALGDPTPAALCDRGEEVRLGNGNVIVVTLVAPQYGGLSGTAARDRYVTVMASLVDRLLALDGPEGHQLRVLILPHLESGASSDRALALAIRGQVRDAARLHILQPMNPIRMVAVMTGCAAAVTTRMHSLIFTVLARLPVVPIVYLPKMRSFVDENRLDETAIEMTELLDMPDATIDRITGWIGSMLRDPSPSRRLVEAARERNIVESARNAASVAALFTSDTDRGVRG
jgi:polysaccharide pyruvyl transferase WcaK-like protein